MRLQAEYPAWLVDSQHASPAAGAAAGCGGAAGCAGDLGADEEVCRTGVAGGSSGMVGEVLGRVESRMSIGWTWFCICTFMFSNQ